MALHKLAAIVVPVTLLALLGAVAGQISYAPSTSPLASPPSLSSGSSNPISSPSSTPTNQSPPSSVLPPTYHPSPSPSQMPTNSQPIPSPVSYPPSQSPLSSNPPKPSQPTYSPGPSPLVFMPPTYSPSASPSPSISTPSTYAPSESPRPSISSPPTYDPSASPSSLISIPPTYPPSRSPSPSPSISSPPVASPSPTPSSSISIPPTSSLSPSPSPSSTPSGLSVGYYKYLCPKAEAIVRDAVKSAIDGNRGTGAGLIRLFFHDCFVQGCDASVVLNTTGSSDKTERASAPNQSLRGFEVIDAAKAALESACPGVVSCADIVAFAGRDATFFLSGTNAVDFDMPAGRYDGRVSLDSEALANLPPPSASLEKLKEMFAAKGLDAEDMVTLSGATNVNPGLGAGLIRMAFHDCFVQGCDGSILLDATPANPRPEKLGGPNFPSMRGFDVVDAAKAALEKACPGVVSCADVVQFAARDAAFFLSGSKVYYSLPGGRFDGRVSFENETLRFLPPSTFNLSQLIQSFSAKGLSVDDLVVLSGGHTIGRSHCSSFVNNGRLNASTSDMNPRLATVLKGQCPASANFTNDPTVVQDTVTPNKLDNQYYWNVLSHKVLFKSDAALLTSTQTARMVLENAGIRGRFERKFAKAMLKMSRIEVKTAANGEIRKNCHVVN